MEEKYTYSDTGGRAYTIYNGKFYKTIPFGDPIEISEEEYNQGSQEEKRKDEEKQRERNEKNEFEENLKKVGYVDLPSKGFNIDVKEYKKRIYNVLVGRGSNYISGGAGKSTEVLETENKSQQTSTEVSISISQALSRNVVEVQDIYKQNIELLFEQYEKQVLSRSLTEEQYKALFNLFLLGHITDPILFHRFEALKKLDTKCYMQRLYTYGMKHGDAIPENPEQEEVEIIDEMALEMILYALKYSNTITLNDLDNSAEKLHEKLKANFVFTLKERIAGGWKGLWKDPYMHSLLPDMVDIYNQVGEEEQKNIDEKMKSTGYISDRSYREQMLTYERNGVVMVATGKIEPPRYMRQLNDGIIELMSEREESQCRAAINAHNMQQFLGFTRDELNQYVIEAKRLYVQDYLTFVDNLSFYNFVAFDKKHLATNIYNLHSMLPLIREAAEHYEIDIAQLEDLITNNLTTMMKEGLEKYKNKEVIDTESRRKGTIAASYRSSAGVFDEQLTDICKAMKLFGIQNSDCEDWENNKKHYHDEYVQFHESNFTAGRRESTRNKFNLDLTVDKEGISVQLVPLIKEKLLAKAKANVLREAKKYGQFPFTTITKQNIFELLNRKVLFHSGFLTLVKNVIPDATERKEFRRNVKKNVAEESIQEVLTNLSNKETADHVSYLLVDPLLQVFKKYGGKHREAKMKINYGMIEENYKEYVKSHVAKEVQRHISKVNTFLKGKSKEEIIYVYNHFTNIDLYLHSFISNYITKKLQKKKRELQTKEMRDCFELNKQQFGKNYPGNYLVLVSRMGYMANEIEELLPADLLEAFMKVFTHSQGLKEKFFENIIPTWLRLNLGPGGKVQRIIEEKIHENANKDETIAFAVQYIVENVESIFIHDLQEILLRGGTFSWPTIDIIRPLIAQRLEKRKETFGQQLLGQSGEVTKRLE